MYDFGMEINFISEKSLIDVYGFSSFFSIQLWIIQCIIEFCVEYIEWLVEWTISEEKRTHWHAIWLLWSECKLMAWIQFHIFFIQL